jgi:hypothetical protein
MANVSFANIRETEESRAKRGFEIFGSIIPIHHQDKISTKPRLWILKSKSWDLDSRFGGCGIHGINVIKLI